MRKSLAVTAAIVLLAAAQSAFAGVTIIDATIQAHAYNLIGDSRYNIDGREDKSLVLSSPWAGSVAASSFANTRMNTGSPFNTYPYLSGTSSGTTRFSVLDPLSFDFGVTGVQTMAVAPSPGILSYVTANYLGELVLDFAIDEAYQLGWEHDLTAAGQTLFHFLLRDSDGNDLITRSRLGGALFEETLVLNPGSYRMYLTSGLLDSITSAEGAERDNMVDSRQRFSFTTPPVAAVPEPESWLLMLVAFGLTGATLRRRNRHALRARHA